jgi:kumamolisin
MSSSLEEMARRPPRERRYLSREELLRAYGADPADIAKVRRFARQHGLAVVAQDLAARTVELRGTVAALSRAFNVQLFLYRHPRGIYRGRVGVIHVPAELENIVQAVIGLDNRPQTRTHFRTITDRGGAWFNAAGVSYSPTQVGQLYDFPTDVNGQGQCIAIIELGGGYTMNDLNIYFQQLGLNTPNVSSVSVLGGMNSPTGNPSGPDGEVMLDIEVAGAVAQGAKIVVYFTPNTDRGFLRAINRAINDRVNNPSVISISWGGPESSWTLQSMQAFNQAFQAAAQLGITVCVAAGDGGSSDGVPGSIAHVDFPASSPYVLACGGTQLVGSGTTIATEIVWDDGATGGATGGGVSNVFQLPSWQSNANVPPSVNPNHHVGRGVPDVAGDADPITGYKVRVDGGDHIFGGTSAVAPLWAGLISLINQKLGVRVGYLNPTLYSLSSSTEAFHDITKGDNDNTGAVGGYNAAIGWDACTGLGSPDGQQLTNALGG